MVVIGEALNGRRLVSTDNRRVVRSVGWTVYRYVTGKLPTEEEPRYLEHEHPKTWTWYRGEREPYIALGQALTHCLEPWRAGGDLVINEPEASPKLFAVEINRYARATRTRAAEAIEELMVQEGVLDRTVEMMGLTSYHLDVDLLDIWVASRLLVLTP